MRRNRRRIGVVQACALALAALTALGGCAAHREPPGRPIEERPRPPQPPAEPPIAQNPPAAPSDSAPPPPPQMTPSGEESVRALVARDTTAVSKALARCSEKNLNPEQESTYGATLDLLAQVRAALARGDFARARSIARNARQLATSLDCQ